MSIGLPATKSPMKSEEAGSSSSFVAPLMLELSRSHIARPFPLSLPEYLSSSALITLEASSIGSAIFHASLPGTRVDMIKALARAFLVQKSSEKFGGGRFGWRFEEGVEVGGSIGPDEEQPAAWASSGVAVVLPLEALTLDFLLGMMLEFKMSLMSADLSLAWVSLDSHTALMCTRRDTASTAPVSWHS